MNYKGHELLYNAAAHFILSERYEDGIFLAMNKSLESICDILAEMSAQAEAYNRFMGRKTSEPLNKQGLLVTMRPMDIPIAKQVVLEAVTKGLSAEEDPNKEVDLVLEELQKKTESD